MTVHPRGHSEADKPPLKVLESVAPPANVTKYIDQVVAGNDGNIHFIYFSWKELIFGQYDVFHVHWPEFLVRGKIRLVRIIRRLLFRIALLRLSYSRVSIVRTMHNITPHAEGDSQEKHLLAKLDRITSAWVRINETTEFPETGIKRTILHGHYRQKFEDIPKSDSIPGRLVYAGRIEPYKGVESLLSAFYRLDAPESELRIVGKPTEDLASKIKYAQDRDPRISSELAFVPDEVLVKEITSANLVVLPYSEMHNSGILLVALSLNRPALVPWSKANEQIAQEVGPEWVRIYRGSLTSSILEEAVKGTQKVSGDAPNLSRRSWDTVGNAYAVVFRDAAKAKSNKGTWSAE